VQLIIARTREVSYRPCLAWIEIKISMRRKKNRATNARTGSRPSGEYRLYSRSEVHSGCTKIALFSLHQWNGFIRVARQHRFFRVPDPQSGVFALNICNSWTTRNRMDRMERLREILFNGAKLLFHRETARIGLRKGWDVGDGCLVSET